MIQTFYKGKNGKAGFFFAGLRRLRKQNRHLEKRNRLPHLLAGFIIAVEIAATVMAFGCSSSQPAGSSSSPESESAAESTPAAVNRSVSPASSQLSSGASSQSDGEYALPAGSKAPADSEIPTGSNTAPGSTAPDSRVQSGSPSNSAAESASQPAEQTSSQPVFQSVFGNDTESDNAEAETSGPEISMTEYDKITEGMTYADVKSIIGSDGKLQRESGEKGSDLYLAVYRWDGPNSTDSYADLTFEDGKLDMKIQFGLQ